MYYPGDQEDMVANIGDMAIDGQIDIAGVYYYSQLLAQDFYITTEEVLVMVREDLERREHLYDEVPVILDELNRLLGDGRSPNTPVMLGATAPAA